MQTDHPARDPFGSVTPLRRGTSPSTARKATAQRAAPIPESHDDRLARIRQQIEDGEYEVDPRDVARSIIDRGLL